MGWREIIQETIEIAKAKLWKAVESLDDPQARVDLAMRDYKEAVRMLKRASVLIVAKNDQIKLAKQKVEKRRNTARYKAKKLLEEGDRELAMIHSDTVAYSEVIIEEWGKVTIELEQVIRSIEKDLVRADNTMDALELRIDIEKMRVTVAEARIEVSEQLTGMKKTGTSLFDAVNKLTTLREDKEATAQALQEMRNAGMLPDITQKIFEPDMARADEIMKELEAEIEKTKSMEDPEIKIPLRSPLERMKDIKRKKVEVV